MQAMDRGKFTPGKRISDILKVQLLIVLPVIHYLIYGANC